MLVLVSEVVGSHSSYVTLKFVIFAGVIIL